MSSGQSRQERVSHRRDLAEGVRGVRFRSRLVPGAPLVHDQLHVVLGSLAAQRLPVAVDVVLHQLAFAQQFECTAPS